MPRAAAGFGSPGLGDPFFQLAGNGGYDVAHYGLALDYDARDRPARRDGRHLRARHAVARALRSRPARLRRQPAARRRPPGRLPARRPGADRHAAPGVARGQRLHRARALRRRARGDHRPRRFDRGLGPDRRRRLRRRRAAGRARLVPGQRQPAGQGDLRHGHHGARRHHGDGQRRARRAHLATAGARPGCGTRTTRWRPTWRRRPTARFNADADARRRDPGLQRRRSDAAADAGPIARRGAGHRALLQRALRAVSVQRGGRDRRRRARRRLRAGEPDQAELRQRARRDDARPRARAPVVRRRRHAAPVARHLAARGLRRVVGVDLERAPRRPDRPGELRRASSTRGNDRGIWDPPPGRVPSTPPSCSATRSTTAAR